MDVLIRFSKDVFSYIKEAKDYFNFEVPKADNYFYFNSIKQINKDDILYFSFKGKIIIAGKFTGKTKIRKERFHNGYQIDNIEIFDKPIDINTTLFKGRSIFYIRTDEQKEELKKVPYSIVNKVKNITVKSLKLENFTLFQNELLEFSTGINIIIGENSTGKSQILKLIYAIIQANNNNKKIDNAILEELKEVFKPTNNEINSLISFDKNKSSIKINLSKYEINFNFTKNSKYEVNIENSVLKYYQKDSIFIPAKEILSNFKGFQSLWQKIELPFDKTFFDLTMNLDFPLLKNKNSIDKINQKLEEILEGEIEQHNGEFYLRKRSNKKLIVVSMIAEGLRKIGTISYLFKNGSLNKNCILFWDEPEANLNPKFIKYIAELFIYLENKGVQIFVATHSLFLIKEIEILRKKENSIKYFSFGFDDNNSLRISQDKEFEYLDNLVILDEALEQSDRFMEKNDND
jgi:predicted ATPase